MDSASDVLKIPVADVDPSPTEFVEGGLNCVTGLGKYRGRLIVLLDMSKLLDSGLGRKEQAERVHGEARGAAAGKP